jgi:hypothetical protein
MFSSVTVRGEEKMKLIHDVDSLRPAGLCHEFPVVFHSYDRVRLEHSCCYARFLELCSNGSE